jgi:hypothetical protein
MLDIADVAAEVSFTSGGRIKIHWLRGHVEGQNNGSNE